MTPLERAPSRWGPGWKPAVGEHPFPESRQGRVPVLTAHSHCSLARRWRSSRSSPEEARRTPGFGWGTACQGWTPGHHCQGRAPPLPLLAVWVLSSKAPGRVGVGRPPPLLYPEKLHFYPAQTRLLHKGLPFKSPAAEEMKTSPVWWSTLESSRWAGVVPRQHCGQPCLAAAQSKSDFTFGETEVPHGRSEVHPQAWSILAEQVLLKVNVITAYQYDSSLPASGFQNTITCCRDQMIIENICRTLLGTK